jgi:hypothetical protein
MDIISKEKLLQLIESRQGKAISIYMPAFQAEPEARQNPIRLKNLFNEAKALLMGSGMDSNDIQHFTKPLADLLENESFWQDKDEGLALFLDANELRIYNLPNHFEEFVECGDMFYIAPLIPIYEGDGQFFLLSLDKQRPKIYKGSKYRLAQVEDIELPDSLRTLFDSFYEFHEHIQFHSKTRSPSPDVSQATGERQGIFFGHGGDDFDENAEIRNYYHQFDEALKDYLGDKDAPLVLAGVGFLHPIYKEANSYPYLMEDGITKDVGQLPIEELQEESWKIVQNQYKSNVKQALNVYYTMQDSGEKTTQNIEMIVSSAYFKRVNTLFLAENVHVWGKFNPDDNKVILDKTQSSENQDLLNLAAVHTLLNGGNVLMLKKEEIPGKADAAAILRY